MLTNSRKVRPCGMLRVVGFVGFFTWLLVGAASLHGQQPPSSEDIASLVQISNLQLSPTGESVAYVLTLPSNGNFVTELWEQPSAGGQAVRVFAKPGIDRLEWSPNSAWIAYIGDEETGELTGTSQVYISSPSGSGHHRVTAFPTGVQEVHWAPSGDKIAVLSRRSSVKSDPTMIADTPEPRILWQAKVTKGTVQEWSAVDVGKDIRSFVWSPDGSQIACVTAQDASPLSDFSQSLVLIDVDQKKIIRTLSESAAGLGSVRWSADGKQIAFFEAMPGNVFASWLAVVPAAGGTAKPRLRDQPLTVWDAQWGNDSNALIAEVVAGTRASMVRIDAKTGASQTLFEVMISQRDFGFSTAAGNIAFTQQSMDSPADLWLFDHGKSSRRTELNPQTKNWSQGKVEAKKWVSSRDGAEIDGIVIQPPNRVPGLRYPMVVEAHPGDRPAWVGFHADWSDWGQLLASRGYVVFMPNTRGVTGAGWRSHNHLSDWGGVAYQDLEDGVEMLVKEGIADPDRIGIGGWSNGGFMTEFAITHSSRYKAAVVLAGHADFFSLYGTSSSMRPYLEYSFGNPHRDRSIYDQHSPISNVARCRTPTLLMAGERDSSVPPSQGLEFHRALKSLGVPTEMIVYPREGHSIHEMKHRIDFQNRVVDWFDRHLRPGPHSKE